MSLLKYVLLLRWLFKKIFNGGNNQENVQPYLCLKKAHLKLILILQNCSSQRAQNNKNYVRWGNEDSSFVAGLNNGENFREIYAFNVSNRNDTTHRPNLSE